MQMTARYMAAVVSTASLMSVTMATDGAEGVADAAVRRMMHDDQTPRTYAVDGSRIAIRNVDAAGRTAAARAHKLTITDDAGWHTDEWALAEMPPGRRHARAAADMCQALAGQVDFVTPVLFDEHGRTMVMTRDIILRVRAGVEEPALARILARHESPDAVVVKRFEAFPGMFVVRTSRRTGDEVLMIANAIAGDPDVEFAHPDRIITVETQQAVFPDEGSFPSLWGLHNDGQSGACHSAGTEDADMDAPEAWALTLGDPSVIILVIDTGVQLDHVDLNIDPLLGADFTSQGGGGHPVNECDNHGTLVAGCAGANWNGFGLVGSAPLCRLASARAFIAQVTNPCGNGATGQDSWIVSAIDWSTTIGARVVVSSFTTTVSSAMTSAYNSTHAGGVVHCAAAGNGGTEGIVYPSTLGSTLSVGGFTKNGARSPLSNFGAGMDFLAPSRQIRTTDRMGADGNENRHYTCVEGTSFAAPYAAGLAGLVLSLEPGLTADEVEAAMRSGCVDVGATGYDNQHGHGLLNMYNSLEPFAVVPCLGDCMPPGGNGVVNIDDLLMVVGSIGTEHLECDFSPDNGDGTFGNGEINVDDVLVTISNFGPCD